MRSVYVLLLFSGAFMACRPAPETTILISPEVQGKQVDSAALERPIFGTTGTTPKAPFGPFKQAIRLLKVLKNGQLTTEYSYDQQARLTEVKTYLGRVVFSSNRYFYEGYSLNNLEFWRINYTPEGNPFPAYAELIKQGTYHFKSIDSGLRFSQNYKSATSNQYETGSDSWFDSAGWLVWTQRQGELTLLDGSSSAPTADYQHYIRDEVGNVVRYKYHNTSEHTGFTYLYQYDTRPNPYFTTGDVLDPQALSPANVVIEQSQTATGITETVRNTYTYRPDGYPATVTFSRGPEVITLTFVYNQ